MSVDMADMWAFPFNLVKKWEDITAGGGYSLVASPAPPWSSTSQYVAKFSPSQLYSYAYGFDWTYAASIIHGFMLYISGEWPPGPTANRVDIAGIVDNTPSSFIRLSLVRTGSSTHKLRVYDTNGVADEYTGSPVDSGKWYLMEYGFNIAASSRVVVKLGEISGSSLVSYDTLIDSSGHDFSQGIAGRRMWHGGQPFDVLTNQTYVYISQPYVRVGCDLDTAADWLGNTAGWRHEYWRPTKESAVPDYGLTGSPGGGDNLSESTTWDKAGDEGLFTSANYLQGEEGCIDLDGPSGELDSGDVVLGSEWLWKGSGDSSSDIFEVIWGKKDPSISSAIVSNETSGIRSLGTTTHRKVQTADPPSGDRSPAANQKFVIGHGNIGVAAEKAKLIEAAGAVFVQRPGGSIPLFDHHYRMLRAG